MALDSSNMSESEDSADGDEDRHGLMGQRVSKGRRRNDETDDDSN